MRIVCVVREEKEETKWGHSAAVRGPEKGLVTSI